MPESCRQISVLETSSLTLKGYKLPNREKKFFLQTDRNHTHTQRERPHKRANYLIGLEKNEVTTNFTHFHTNKDKGEVTPVLG